MNSDDALRQRIRLPKFRHTGKLTWGVQNFEYYSRYYYYYISCTYERQKKNVMILYARTNATESTLTPICIYLCVYKYFSPSQSYNRDRLIHIIKTRIPNAVHFLISLFIQFLCFPIAEVIFLGSKRTTQAQDTHASKGTNKAQAPTVCHI